MHDQFEDHINATIVDMAPDAIAQGIEDLLKDTNLQRKYVQNLEKQRVDNSSEVEKLYTLF